MNGLKERGFTRAASSQEITGFSPQSGNTLGPTTRFETGGSLSESGVLE
jgi:hypothetical protein